MFLYYRRSYGSQLSNDICASFLVCLYAERELSILSGCFEDVCYPKGYPKKAHHKEPAVYPKIQGISAINKCVAQLLLFLYNMVGVGGTGLAGIGLHIY